MSNKATVRFDEELKAIEGRYRGSDVIGSISSLSFGSQNDSSRMIMFTSAKNQCVVPTHVEKPRIFTNHEDMIGDLGSHNIHAKHDFVVDKVIKKFHDLDTTVQPKYVFVYYPTLDSYDVIQRVEVEDLPEKYGFMYDNRTIDALKEGDEVRGGTLLTSPTCYDEFQNYGYGKNITFLYQISNDNLEDAITVTQSLADDFTSYEVERVKVSINDNNALLNLFGDREHYKAFPDVGEYTDGMLLCARRTLNTSQILFDYKEPNTRRTLEGDQKFYNNGQVVDIDIYCNHDRETIPECSFNEQLLRYLDRATKFHQEIVSYIGELIDKGCNVSTRMKELYKRSKELLDPAYEVKDENNSKFSNIVIYFTIKRLVGLQLGQKLTGRHGNKGVIGKIIPDYQAIHVEDGRRVDIIFDTLGVINRLNCMQLFEQSITFRAQRILERIQRTDNVKEKENYLFPFIRCFSPAEADSVQKDYEETCKTKKEKLKWFEYVEKYGIFVNIPPFWRDKSLYDCLLDCDKMFPWIEPYRVAFFDTVSNRWVWQLTKQPVGSMYVMKLKQSSKKGLSARSTGSISKRGVPEKSDEAKKFNTSYSKIPVRLGIQETQTTMITIPAEIIAKGNLVARNSPVARRKLGAAQLTSKGDLEHFEIDDTMTNRNIEILSAYLLSMGLELRHTIDMVDLSPDPGIKYHVWKNTRYLATSDEMRQIIARDIAIRKTDPDDGEYLVIGDDVTRERFVDELAYKIADTVEMELMN